MLDNLRSAPIIDDPVFNHHTVKPLCDELIDICGTPSLWVEQGGTMFVNDDEYAAVAALLPTVMFLKPGAQDEQALDAYPEDGREADLTMKDEFGSPLLNAYAVVLEHPTTKTLCAHVFNGFADSLLVFEDGETLEQVQDTVFTMFAVRGQGGQQ